MPTLKQTATMAAILMLATAAPAPAETAPLRFGGKPPAELLNIAHRGARAFAPENTLEAIEKAVPFGAHMVELDVHLTGDGEIVVIHDDTLDRCSDVRSRFPDRQSTFVSDFTLAEIQQLDAGSWYVRELKKPAGERQAFLRSLTDAEVRMHISAAELAHYASGKVRHPPLRAALELARKHQLLVNIEIKSLPRLYPEIADKVVRLVGELKMERQVIVSSFDHVQLARVRALSPVIALAVLSSDRLHDPGRYARELLDADAYNPGCYGDVDSLGFHSVTGKLTADEIQKARKAGIGVNAWTENDPERLRALIDAGVSGIFTDYPNRLRDVLTKRK